MARRPRRTPLLTWRLARGLSRNAIARATGIPHNEVKRLEQCVTDVRWSTLVTLLHWMRRQPDPLRLEQLVSWHGLDRVRRLRRAAVSGTR